MEEVDEINKRLCATGNLKNLKHVIVFLNFRLGTILVMADGDNRRSYHTVLREIFWRKNH